MLSPQEQQRLQVMNRVLEGALGVPQAAVVLGVSERHTWRLVAAYPKRALPRWPTAIGAGPLEPLS